MKSKEQIDVWINTEGGITIDAVGFTGKSCEEATRFLEEGLGIVGRKQRGLDYYKKSSNRNQNKNKQTT
jgi:hypothetical protein